MRQTFPDAWSFRGGKILIARDMYTVRAWRDSGVS